MSDASLLEFVAVGLNSPSIWVGSLRYRDATDQFAYEPVGGDTVGFGLVIQQYSVSQYIIRDRLHVLRANIVTPGEPRVGAGTTIQRDGGARTRPPLNPARKLVTVRRGLSGSQNQMYQILFYVFRQVYIEYRPPRLEQGAAELWFSAPLCLIVSRPHRP